MELLYNQTGNPVMGKVGAKYYYLKEEKLKSLEVYQKLSELKCINLKEINVYEVGNNSFTYMEEHLNGQTLSDVLVVNDYSKIKWIKIIRDIFKAVGTLHENSIIHRDIKPDNIIVGRTNSYLIDYNIARIYDGDKDRDTTLFGTRGYAPPEQFGYMQTDFKADLYSLGKVLEQIQTVSGIDFKMIIKKSTAFDPGQRYQSIEEMKKEFELIAIQYQEITKPKELNLNDQFAQDLKKGLSAIYDLIKVKKLFFIIVVYAMLQAQMDALIKGNINLYFIIYYCIVMAIIYLYKLYTVNLNSWKSYLRLLAYLSIVYIGTFFMLEAIFPGL